MKELYAAINDAPKPYLSLANIGQYVEVTNSGRDGVTIMVKVDDIAGDKFIGSTIKYGSRWPAPSAASMRQ